MALARGPQDGSICLPWHTDPYGVVSLLDMLRLYADIFLKEFAEINALENKLFSLAIAQPSLQVPPQRCVEVTVKVGLLFVSCTEHGLTSTAQKCVRINETLEARRMVATYGELKQWLAELRERLEDDLQKEVFLHLSAKEVEWYEKPDKDWHEAITRFSKIRHDVEESSKCFALGRYAASLFHILLVAELGIIEVAKLLSVEGDKPGWGALDRLKKIHDKAWNDKSSLEQKYSDLLKNTLPLAFAIKDSWRHKLSHVDNKLVWMDTDFSPEVASEIIAATRGFMRRLANDLPRTP
jgi:hypothetical protein